MCRLIHEVLSRCRWVFSSQHVQFWPRKVDQVPPLTGALVRFRAVGARKWLFAHPSSGALIDVSPEKAGMLVTSNNGEGKSWKLLENRLQRDWTLFQVGWNCIFHPPGSTWRHVWWFVLIRWTMWSRVNMAFSDPFCLVEIAVQIVTAFESCF